MLAAARLGPAGARWGPPIRRPSSAEDAPDEVRALYLGNISPAGNSYWLGSRPLRVRDCRSLLNRDAGLHVTASYCQRARG
jgi:hypothetical protein